MTDRELMQQALDALQSVLPELESVGPLDKFERALAAIAVLERLAQPEQKPMHPTLQKMWEGYFDKCYKREWVGLTDVEIHRTTVLMGFNPEWTTEIGVVHAIVRNLEAKLKERNT